MMTQADDGINCLQLCNTCGGRRAGRQEALPKDSVFRLAFAQDRPATRGDTDVSISHPHTHTRHARSSTTFMSSINAIPPHARATTTTGLLDALACPRTFCNIC